MGPGKPVISRVKIRGYFSPVKPIYVAAMYRGYPFKHPISNDRFGAHLATERRIFLVHVGEGRGRLFQLRPRKGARSRDNPLESK